MRPLKFLTLQRAGSLAAGFQSELGFCDPLGLTADGCVASFKRRRSVEISDDNGRTPGLQRWRRRHARVHHGLELLVLWTWGPELTSQRVCRTSSAASRQRDERSEPPKRGAQRARRGRAQRAAKTTGAASLPKPSAGADKKTSAAGPPKSIAAGRQKDERCGPAESRAHRAARKTSAASPPKSSAAARQKDEHSLPP